MNKKIFISHASEDKESFVRDLAKLLKEKGLDVWYDEYEIKPSMSIRESIDNGLASCDAGLVVLSKDFLQKKWTIWELNGLVQKLLSNVAIIIPVYYNISHYEIARISPSLADIMAIIWEGDTKSVADKVYETLYPTKPILMETRDIISTYGLQSPDFYDNWWLERIEFLGHQKRLYAPWTLPRNPESSNNSKSYSLAWSCMRYDWINKVSKYKMNQFTPVEEVVGFIHNNPGMTEAAYNNIEYLALYAPQLFFSENEFYHDIYQNYINTKIKLAKIDNLDRIKCELTFDGMAPTCNRIYALMDENFGGYTPFSLLRHFIEGEQMGPASSNLDYWDVLIIMCSDLSNIYPQNVREILLDGFKNLYSIKKLESVFKEKESNTLAKYFSEIETMEKAVGEIVEDRKININTTTHEIAKRICDLNLRNDLYSDKLVRLTIPIFEIRYGFRGITMQEEFEES